jgi:CDP-paratose 2-epimerase
MSCIYGPHQFGNEDQGWVAHFLIRALGGEPISIYGDGLQVRDILYVDDLVDAMLTAQASMPLVAGEAFNIGGGPERTTSLVELLETIAALQGSPVAVEFNDWREADQRYYVSDTRKFCEATAWAPTVSVREGVASLYGWLRESRKVAAGSPLAAVSVSSAAAAP